MEPQLPSPSHTPENAPSHLSGGEVLPHTPTPEWAPAPAQPEQQESREQHQGGPSGDPVAAQPTYVAPPLPTIAPAEAPASTAAPSNTNPSVAADEDLIEKEWVEKAKKVIAETKNDPHLQEAEVSKLQADYLQKRYGKTVQLPSDG